MHITATDKPQRTSLPSRERGLKCKNRGEKLSDELVAPLAGARIEIGRRRDGVSQRVVAPLAGARIEMREKCTRTGKADNVAPLAGARIEMEESIVCCDRGFSGRSPRGSED